MTIGIQGRMTMASSKKGDDIKRRLEMDENMWLKIHSEMGDFARVLRGIISRVEKLERKMSDVK